jgi:hypothetical protein
MEISIKETIILRIFRCCLHNLQRCRIMSRSILNILIYHTEILFTNTSKILHVYWRNVKRCSVQNILTCAMFSVCEIAYYHRHGKNSVVWMYFVKMLNNGNMNEPSCLYLHRTKQWFCAEFLKLYSNSEMHQHALWYSTFQKRGPFCSYEELFAPNTRGMFFTPLPFDCPVWPQTYLNNISHALR